MRLIIAIIAALVISSTPFTERHDEPISIVMEREHKLPDLTPYEWAEAITGTPATILRAIARAESNERDDVPGDGGISLGRFQVNETFRDWRVSRYGEYDPTDPYSAAVLAGKIYADSLDRLCDQSLAIAAHRQGACGVERNGPTWWYVERVYENLSERK